MATWIRPVNVGLNPLVADEAPFLPAESAPAELPPVEPPSPVATFVTCAMVDLPV